jgi:SpoVK/Ycf46/Vps4 family AAA+-type ATPase
MILPQQPRLDALAQVRGVVSKARRRTPRERGIGILFAGGTAAAKTKAAQALAHGLGLGLHRIDLSATISRYIGETEKNLAQLFDTAQKADAVLFFDEADALFGKRTKVKDSHNRYANIELNYLLQRMEAFRGVSIMAVRAATKPPPAALRRLRYVVRFARKPVGRNRPTDRPDTRSRRSRPNTPASRAR